MRRKEQREGGRRGAAGTETQLLRTSERENQTGRRSSQGFTLAPVTSCVSLLLTFLTSVFGRRAAGWHIFNNWIGYQEDVPSVLRGGSRAFTLWYEITFEIDQKPTNRRRDVFYYSSGGHFMKRGSSNFMTSTTQCDSVEFRAIVLWFECSWIDFVPETLFPTHLNMYKDTNAVGGQQSGRPMCSLWLRRRYWCYWARKFWYPISDIWTNFIPNIKALNRKHFTY